MYPRHMYFIAPPTVEPANDAGKDYSAVHPVSDLEPGIRIASTRLEATL
jgi:hypothetical protein